MEFDSSVSLPNLKHTKKKKPFAYSLASFCTAVVLSSCFPGKTQDLGMLHSAFSIGTLARWNLLADCCEHNHLELGNLGSETASFATDTQWVNLNAFPLHLHLFKAIIPAPQLLIQ